MNEIYPLSMYGQGVITLPKAWREQWGVSQFIARVKGRQLIIEPLDQETSLKLITDNPSFDFLKDEPDLY